ncbi:hypothetical protein B0H13DRAFT_1862366 [Mycena leptocephala]|nr:hypothetical protein B0H13DRAFT_1862366 [Mycena leptocephala]
MFIVYRQVQEVIQRSILFDFSPFALVAKGVEQITLLSMSRYQHKRVLEVIQQLDERRKRVIGRAIPQFPGSFSLACAFGLARGGSNYRALRESATHASVSRGQRDLRSLGCAKMPRMRVGDSGPFKPRPLRMGLGRASTDVGTGDLTVLPPVGTGRHMSASSDDAGPERGEFGTCAVKDALLDLPSITVDDAAKETRRRSRLDGGRGTIARGSCAFCTLGASAASRTFDARGQEARLASTSYLSFFGRPPTVQGRDSGSAPRFPPFPSSNFHRQFIRASVISAAVSREQRAVTPPNRELEGTAREPLISLSVLLPCSKTALPSFLIFSPSLSVGVQMTACPNVVREDGAASAHLHSARSSALFLELHPHGASPLSSVLPLFPPTYKDESG